MNLPNKLTLSRIIAVPFVMLALLVDNILQTWNIQSQLIVSVGYYLAFIIFVAASITDLYDGKIARARKIVTPFGSFFDPIADKLLISAVLICFVEMHMMPAWMVIIIIFREFIITGLRILAVRQNVDIPAGILGKYKTISQMVMVISMLVYLSIMSSHGKLLESYFISGWSIAHWLYGLIYLMMVWAVITTFISGWCYVKDHWELIVEGSK
jgi:CDP-diacylglycerol--glycerol-3-phosphate 3-phosphatidyltransferase